MNQVVLGSVNGTGKPARGSSAEALIAATADILSERSTLDVSLSEIAKRSNLNSALIKYHFGNKDGLLMALLERDAEKAMGALEQLVGMPIPADQKLRIHISGIINAYFRSPYLNRLIHYMIERGNEEASAQVAEIFIAPMIEAYRAIIRQGVEENTIRPVDPHFLYLSLVGACDHLFHTTRSVRELLGIGSITEEVKQQYTAHATDLILRGLRV